MNPSMASPTAPRSGLPMTVRDVSATYNVSSSVFRPRVRGDSGRSTMKSVRAGLVIESESNAAYAYDEERGSRRTGPANDAGRRPACGS